MSAEGKIVYVHTGTDKGIYKILKKTEIPRLGNVAKNEFRSYSALLVKAGMKTTDAYSLAKSSNFNMCHSLKELDEYYKKEVERMEKNIEWLRKNREYTRGKAVEAGMSEENTEGLTCKTEYQYFHDNGVDTVEEE